MKVNVDEHGTVIVDDVKKEISELTASFLEDLVEQLLNDEATIEVLGNSPVAEFFNSLQIGTKKDSDLRLKITEMNKQKEEAKDAVEKVANEDIYVDI